MQIDVSGLLLSLQADEKQIARAIIAPYFSLLGVDKLLKSYLSWVYDLSGSELNRLIIKLNTMKEMSIKGFPGTYINEESIFLKMQSYEIGDPDMQKLRSTFKKLRTLAKRVLDNRADIQNSLNAVFSTNVLKEYLDGQAGLERVQGLSQFYTTKNKEALDYPDAWIKMMTLKNMVKYKEEAIRSFNLDNLDLKSQEKLLMTNDVDLVDLLMNNKDVFIKEYDWDHQRRL